MLLLDCEGSDSLGTEIDVDMHILLVAFLLSHSMVWFWRTEGNSVLNQTLNTKLFNLICMLCCRA
jgi:hypothetical protein